MINPLLIKSIIHCRRTFFKPDDMDGDFDSDLDFASDADSDIFVVVNGNMEDEGNEMAEDDSDYEINEEDEVSEDTSDTEQNDDAPQPGRPRSQGSAEEEDEEEEDDVIKAIIAATKTARTHPPDINIDDFVVDLSFHPEQDVLAVGTMSGDAFIYKYTVDENTLVNTLELHTKAIRDIEFSLDGATLFSTSKDRSILLTDIETGKYQRMYEQAHEVPVCKLNVFSETGFATGGLRDGFFNVS